MYAHEVTLLDKEEVSRTKQLMSLRLGGPALGFVLITSRCRGEEEEEDENTKEAAVFLFFILRWRGRMIGGQGENKENKEVSFGSLNFFYYVPLIFLPH